MSDLSDQTQDGFDTPKVLILMATHNGAPWLQQQLDSIKNQTHLAWELIVRDDASNDKTVSLIQGFLSNCPGRLIHGAGEGAAANFRSLILETYNSDDNQHWIAFADQDDVWFSDKLERAVRALRDLPQDQPALYCSRTTVVDKDLSNPRPSAVRPKPTGFQNALVQNVAAGNTIVMNAAAAVLLRRATSLVDSFVVHDWFTYQLISGVGGVIIHDDEPTMLYRQHGGNSIGASIGLRAKLIRGLALFRGQLRDWNLLNIKTMRAVESHLSAESQRQLNLFETIHTGSLMQRCQAMYRLKPYRQSTLTTAILWLAMLVRRL